jgi:hypothetical protein
MNALSETKRYTDQQLLFLGYLGDEAGGDIDKAMDLAGYNKGYKSALVRLLKDEIVDVARDTLAGASITAANSLINVLKDPTKPGTDNILKAAEKILDRSGVVKPDESLNVKIPQGGLFILPAKGTVTITSGPKEKVINHEVQLGNEDYEEIIDVEDEA